MSRLRQLLQRPIGERDRMRLFAIAAALLLLAAAVLTATSARQADRPALARASTMATVSAPATGAPQSAGVPLAVLDAGRRFLAGYLPYLYGHAHPPTFEGAAATLRRLLISRPPRVAQAMRRRQPRLTGLAGHRLADPLAWVLTARIADGRATYSIDLVIATGHGGGPLVMSLGGD